MIEGLVREGVTLLLTTQYLEEADQLADDIVVIDQGKVIARGTSDQLKDQVGGERIEIVVAQENLVKAQEVIERVTHGRATVDPGIRRISVPVLDGTQSLIAVIREFDSSGIHALDLALKRPSLDDVFLSLTGHVAEAEIPVDEGKKKGARK